MSIEQYIKERIKEYNLLEKYHEFDTSDMIEELQAVLSKIEELQRQDKWSFHWFDFFNDVYKKYRAERERELQELNK